MKENILANISEISSVCYKLKRINYQYIYVPAKKILGFWNRPEHFDVVGGFSTWECTRKEVESNYTILLEGNTVYHKPYVEFNMTNRDSHTRYFETDEELNEYVEKIKASGINLI